MMDKDEVLQEIEKVANANGYDIVSSGDEVPGKPSWVTAPKLHIGLQQKDGDNRPLLNLDVTIESNRLRVMYDGLEEPEYAEGLNELRTIVGEWLRTVKK